MGDDVDDLDAWYRKTTMVASFWPYDERARLIGEQGTDGSMPLAQTLNR
jgi:hypothetical protein